MQIIKKNYLALLALSAGMSLATQAAEHRIQLSPEDKKLLGKATAHYIQACLDPEKNFRKILIDYRKNNSTARSVLYCATKHGHIGLLEQFFKKTDIPVAALKLADGSTLLHIATQKKQVATVKLLLEKGAKANARRCDDLTPLHFAASDGSCDIAQALLEYKADCNQQAIFNATPAHLAAQFNQESIMRILLAAQADVDPKNVSMSTPLRLAAEFGSYEAARVLAEAKADLNATIPLDNSTPLHTASHRGYKKISKLLALLKADLNARMAKEQTPLHLATIAGQAGIAQLLIKGKANIEALTQNGNTPLHLAAKHGSLSLVQLLLNNGARLTTPNKHGSLPYLPALLNCNYETGIFLLKKTEPLFDQAHPAPPYILHHIADIIAFIGSDNPYVSHYIDIMTTLIAKGAADPDNVNLAGETYLDILNSIKDRDAGPLDDEDDAPEPEEKEKPQPRVPNTALSPEYLALIQKSVQLEDANRKALDAKKVQAAEQEQARIAQKQQAKKAHAKAQKKQKFALTQTKQLPKQEKPQPEQKQEPVTVAAPKTKRTRETIKQHNEAQAARAQREKQRIKREEVVNDMLERIYREEAEDHEAADEQQRDLFQALDAERAQQEFWLEQHTATDGDGGPIG